MNKTDDRFFKEKLIKYRNAVLEFLWGLRYSEPDLISTTIKILKETQELIKYVEEDDDK